jgi:hypothetical protein
MCNSGARRQSAGSYIHTSSYIHKCCARRVGQGEEGIRKQHFFPFIEDYVLQLDNFQTKRKPGRKIRVGEVVLIHEENPKRLMWSTGLVLELRKSCDGLVRSVVLRSPNGNIINRAIQCLYPLEIRNDIWNASYKHVLYKMKRMLLKTGFITNRFHSVWVNSKTGLLGSCPLYKLGWKIPWKNGWGWKPFGCGFNSMQWNTLKTFARKHYIQVNTVHVLEIWKYHSWTPFFTTSFTTSHV